MTKLRKPLRLPRTRKLTVAGSLEMDPYETLSSTDDEVIVETLVPRGKAGVLPEGKYLTKCSYAVEEHDPAINLQGGRQTKVRDQVAPWSPSEKNEDSLRFVGKKATAPWLSSAARPVSAGAAGHRCFARAVRLGSKAHL